MATQYEQQEFIHTLCELIRHDGVTALDALRMYCAEYQVSLTYCIDFGIERTLRKVANEVKPRQA